MNKLKKYNILFVFLLFLSLCSCSNNENEDEGKDKWLKLKEKKKQEIASLLNKHSCVNLIDNKNYKTHYYQKNLIHRNVLFESKPNDVFELNDKYFLFTSWENTRYLDFYLEVSLEISQDIQLD